MRTLGTRRAVLVAGVATLTVAALAACSAGQIAETSLKKSSVRGLNAPNAAQCCPRVAVPKGSAGYLPGHGAARGELTPTPSDPVLVSSQPRPGRTCRRPSVVLTAVPRPRLPPRSPSRPEPTSATPEPMSRHHHAAVRRPLRGASAEPSPVLQPAAARRDRTDARIVGSADGTTTRGPEFTAALIPGVRELSSSSATARPRCAAPVTVPMSPASRGPAPRSRATIPINAFRPTRLVPGATSRTPTSHPGPLTSATPVATIRPKGAAAGVQVGSVIESR